MLTIEKTMELHKELWTKISNILKNQEYEDSFIHSSSPFERISIIQSQAIRSILEREKINRPSNNCFLCQYSIDHDLRSCLCTKDGSCTVNCLDGLYGKYETLLSTGDFEKASELAEQIANLPLNEKYRRKSK